MANFNYNPMWFTGTNTAQQSVGITPKTWTWNTSNQQMQSYKINWTSTKYPWLDVEDEKVVENLTSWYTGYEKVEREEEVYKTYLDTKQAKSFLEDRRNSRAWLDTVKPTDNIAYKTSVLTDMIRTDALEKWQQNVTKIDDDTLIKRLMEAKPELQPMFVDYLNGKIKGSEIMKQISPKVEEQPVEEKDVAKDLWDFFSWKSIDTSREVSQFMDPFWTKWTWWADVWTALNLVWKSILNIIPNTVEFWKWIWQLIFHPKQTVEWLKSIWQWIIDKSKWEDTTPQAQMVTWMWDNIKETVTDPQKLWERIAENPLDILTVVSPKWVATIGKEAVELWAKWIWKTVSTLWKWTAKASNFIWSQAFGINPSTIRTIIKDPELYTQVEKGIINSEELLWQLWKKIDNKISNLWETGKEYQTIKKIANIDTPIDKIDNVLQERWIIIKDWKLDFTNTNMADTSDLNAIQKAYDIVKQPNINIINTRWKLDDLINFESKTTSKWQSIVKSIRNAIDEKAKQEIPWLKELDETYSSTVKQLKSIKKDFLNNDWTFKDNAISRISNLTKKWNEAKLARVQELIPWIEKNINAVKAFEDVTLAWWQKVWAYFRWAGSLWIWFAVSWWNPLWAVVWLLITSPQVSTKLLKWLWYADEFISWITKSIKNWTKLTKKQISILKKWADKLPLAWLVSKDLTTNQ